MADSYDSSVIRGDTLRWTMFVRDSSGGSYDFNGSTLRMHVRNGYAPAKVFASYTTGVTTGSVLTIPNGICGGISANAVGNVVVCVGSSHTENFSPYTKVFYDIQEQKSNGDIETLISGNINVLPDVTKV